MHQVHLYCNLPSPFPLFPFFPDYVRVSFSLRVSLSLSICRTISNAKIKTVKLTVVVVLGHLFCSVPYVFVQLYTVWGNPTLEDSEFLPRFGICGQFLKRYSNWPEMILAPNEVISMWTTLA